MSIQKYQSPVNLFLNTNPFLNQSVQITPGNVSQVIQISPQRKSYSVHHTEPDLAKRINQQSFSFTSNLIQGSSISLENQQLRQRIQELKEKVNQLEKEEIQQNENNLEWDLQQEEQLRIQYYSALDTNSGLKFQQQKLLREYELLKLENQSLLKSLKTS